MHDGGHDFPAHAITGRIASLSSMDAPQKAAKWHTKKGGGLQQSSEKFETHKYSGEFA
jgi:hypothetical protein